MARRPPLRPGSPPQLQNTLSSPHLRQHMTLTHGVTCLQTYWLQKGPTGLQSVLQALLHLPPTQPQHRIRGNCQKRRQTKSQLQHPRSFRQTQGTLLMARLRPAFQHQWFTPKPQREAVQMLVKKAAQVSATRSALAAIFAIPTHTDLSVKLPSTATQF